MMPRQTRGSGVGRDIFLSYSHSEIELMQRVRDSLVLRGLSVWTDEHLTPGTAEWTQATQAAIDAASSVVVILSPQAKQSRWVKETMRYAEDHDVRIFPILARGHHHRAMPAGFLTAQWVDIRYDYEREMTHLAFHIQAHISLEALEKNDPARTREIAQVHAPLPGLAMDASMRRIFPANVAKAVTTLQDRNNLWWRRIDAIHQLRDFAHESVLPVLQNYVQDHDIDVQRAAEQAISRIRVVLERDDSTTITLPQARARQGAQKRPNAVSKIIVTGVDSELRWRFMDRVADMPLLMRGISNYPPALTFGQATVSDEHVLYLFGTPAHPEHRSVWRAMARNAQGMVILLDDTQPPEAVQALMHTLHESGLPYLIAVQGNAGAFVLPDDVPILRLNLFKTEATRAILSTLLQLIDA